MKKSLILLFFFLFNFVELYSQTNVAGTYTNDVTWNSTGSPYNLTARVGITLGHTLTIESGVIVNMNGHLITVGTDGQGFPFWGALNATGVTFNGNGQGSDQNYLYFGYDFGDNSFGTISNCVFNDAGVRISNSHVTISQVDFVGSQSVYSNNNNDYAIDTGGSLTDSTTTIDNVTIDYYTFPFQVSSGASPLINPTYTITNCTYNEISLSGSARNGDWILRNYGLPYYMENRAGIYKGHTLTIEPGVVVNMNGHIITIGGDGQGIPFWAGLNATSVTFNGNGQGSDQNYLYFGYDFGDNSFGTISNCVFNDAGVRISNSHVTISQVDFVGSQSVYSNNNNDYAIDTGGSLTDSTTTIDNVTIDYYTFPFQVSSGASPLINPTYTITNCTYNEISLSGSARNGDWILRNYGLPYYMENRAGIYKGHTLTIEPGVVVNMNGHIITIGGDGQGIPFWAGLNATSVTFNGNGQGSDQNYLYFGYDFGDNSFGTISNCVFNDAGVRISNSHVTISQVDFVGSQSVYSNNNNDYAIDTGGSLTDSTTTIDNVTIDYYTFPFQVSSGASPLINPTYTITNCTYNEISLSGSARNGDWILRNYGLPYYMENRAGIYKGHTLTIEPGVVVNMNGHIITIGGDGQGIPFWAGLNATSVTFNGNGQGSDQNYLYFGYDFGDNSFGTISNCVFNDAGVRISNSHVTISQVDFVGSQSVYSNNNNDYAIDTGGSLTDSTTTIDNVTIDYYTFPFQVSSGASPLINPTYTITNCTYNEISLSGSARNGDWILRNYGLPYYMENRAGIYKGHTLTIEPGVVVNMNGHIITIGGDGQGIPFWAGLNATSVTFNGNGQGSDQNYLYFGYDFGDNSFGTISNCVFNDAGVRISNSHVTISQVDFVGSQSVYSNNNNDYAIDTGGSLTDSTTTIDNVTIDYYTFPFQVSSGASPLINPTYTITNCTYNEISLSGSARNGDWILRNYGLPYYMENRAGIYKGHTLTIEPGVVVNMNGHIITIGGDGQGIPFWAGLNATSVTFNGNGQGSDQNYLYFGYDFGDNSFGTISNCVFNDAGVKTGYVNSVNLNISNSNFLYQNGYGIQNYGSNYQVNAQNNYWGHESGPFHATNNPTGQGCQVSDNVSFTPWLTSPSGIIYSNNVSLSDYELTPTFPVVFPGDTFVARYEIQNNESQIVGVNLDARFRNPVGGYGEFLPYTKTVHVAPGNNWYERECVVPVDADSGVYDFAWWLLRGDNNGHIETSGYIQNQLRVLEGVRPAEINISTNYIDFGTVTVNYYKHKEVFITNSGDDSLIIDDIYFNRLDFYPINLPNFPIVIVPGSSFNFTINFIPDDSLIYNDSLYIESNAWNDSIAIIPTKGSGTFVSVR